MSADKLRSNIDTIRQNMYEAANSVGRDSAEIQLHAATKGVDPIRILDSISCGLTDFGENWVQEATPKIESIADSLDNAISRPIWHMIGHLQSNKVKEALTIFDSIDTIDSLRLAKTVNRRAGENKIIIPAFLEIDFTDDPKRNGFRLAGNSAERHKQFMADIDEIGTLNNVKLMGIMTVAPIGDTPEEARPYFRQAAEILDELKMQLPEHPLDKLSMGMTLDYHIAIQEGATIVRLGTAIFGSRPPGRTY